MTKFIFVTGGVVSSLGKGITAASVAAILEARGLKVTMTKMDPYINIDPGTMSPFQHGEVFVTEDGAETDLDLGYYERFYATPKWRNATTLPVGVFIQRWLKRTSRWLFGRWLGHSAYYRWNQSAYSCQWRRLRYCHDWNRWYCRWYWKPPFMEAVRQMQVELVAIMPCWCILTLVPYIARVQARAKPNQPSTQFKELRSIGLQPGVLICRSEHAISDDNRLKIASFTNVEQRAVILCPDTKSILSNSKYPACPAFRWFDFRNAWVRYPRGGL